MNHFDVLGLPLAFDIDVSDIEKRYIAAQRQYHPDRFVGKPDTDRQAAIMKSMSINDAYQALKSPLSRAKHLLGLKGISVGDEKIAIKPDIQLLEEVMELREKVVNLASAQQAEVFAASVGNLTKNTLAELSRAFGQNDLPNAAQMTIRLGYLLKIMDEIRIQTKRLEAL